MKRVIAALGGVAAAFAAMVEGLELGRAQGLTDWVAGGVFVGVLAVGLPVLYFHCCKRRCWEIWRLVLLGAAAGSLVGLPFVEDSYSPALLLGLFVVAGSLLGLLFWLAAIWRNENLTCPKSFCLPCGTVYRYARDALHRPGTLQSK